ncbi:hypothetical protein ACVWYH_005249 [Bradyrhizobium sp. GM24.11]
MLKLPRTRFAARKLSDFFEVGMAVRNARHHATSGQKYHQRLGGISWSTIDHPLQPVIQEIARVPTHWRRIDA